MTGDAPADLADPVALAAALLAQATALPAGDPRRAVLTDAAGALLAAPAAPATAPRLVGGA